MAYSGYIRDRYGRSYDEDDQFDRDYYWRRRTHDDDYSAMNRGYENRYDRSSGYGRRDYDRDRDDRDERGFFDRASDEVRSWFGDDEAESRRRTDDMRDRRDEYRGSRYRRDDDDDEDRYRRYGRERNYTRGRYDRDDDERYNRRSRYDERDDRGLMERAGDEVRSWFGDDEAERRRDMDERRGYGNRDDRDYDRYNQGRNRGYRSQGRGYDRDYDRERSRYSSNYDRETNDPYGEIGFGSRFGRANRYGEYDEPYWDPYTKRMW